MTGTQAAIPPGLCPIEIARRQALWLILLWSCLTVGAEVRAADPLPVSSDPRVTIELFAKAPQIRTPTGIDVDSRGRVFAIECNTHFRPEGYPGPPADRLLILQDLDENGRCDRVSTFAEGFRFAMSVAVRPAWLPPVRLAPQNGETARAEADKTPFQVFLATRRALFLLEDLNDDGVCDRQTELAWLDTKGDYPHNGLAGFAFDGLGWMYFGFGENLGEPYELFSREMENASHADNTTLTPFRGHGEGGNLYRMRPDGTQLSHWATGFWNPHASCVDAFGHLFTVDNDPDSRPPCRLLHSVQGADFGYRFRNGRKGLHPFTSWNGEVPGTLPMVAGTGEAPSGVLAYEHSAFPSEYLGRLFVTSWGDHRIDTFALKPKGTSFEAVAEPLITGGENFRPVGIAQAPDGSLYCTDWVLRDYKLHGQGRVWKIRPTTPPTATPIPHSPEEGIHSAALVTRRESARQLAQTSPGVETLRRLKNDPRESLRVRSEAAWALGEPAPAERVRQPVADLSSPDPFIWQAEVAALARDRTGVEFPLNHDMLLAERDIPALLLMRRIHPDKTAVVSQALNSPAPLVRRVAVQWIAEEHLQSLRPQVEQTLKSEPMNADLFLATLAALEMLDGKAPQNFDKTPPGKYVLPLLEDPDSSPAVKLQALKLIAPTDPALDLKLVARLSQSEDRSLRLEAIRTLAQARPQAALAPLMEIVATPPASNRDPEWPDYEEAVLGLAAAVHHPDTAERATGSLLAALTHITGSKADADLTREIILSLKPRLADPAVQQAVQNALAALPETAAEKPVHDSQWRTALAQSMPAGSQASAIMRGRILFNHPNSVGCVKCHAVDGRGGRIGPELTHIGGSFSREKLIDSILEPSREISPQFTNWNMLTLDGRVLTGMIVNENDGATMLGQTDGTLITVKTAEIEERVPQTTSVMPEKLEEQLSVSDFQDLLAYLQSLK